MCASDTVLLRPCPCCMQTLVNQTGAPSPITPHAFSGCKCDGTDHCEPVVHYPLIVLKRSDCPCTFTSQDNPSGPSNPTNQPSLLLPTLSQCPTTCSFDLVDGSTRTGACSSTLPNPAVPGRRLLGAAATASCPDGYLNSRQPCGMVPECGVCCVPFHIDFTHTNPYA
jgi:hypothetical protein